MLRLLLTALLFSAGTPALAIYKCESGGKVAYSDTPCINGQNNVLSPVTQPTAASDAHSRLLRDKAELGRLERERHQGEAQDERERARDARLAANHRKKCDSLALRRKWAEEDAAQAAGKSAEKVIRKAHRSAEKFDLECGKK